MHPIMFCLGSAGMGSPASPPKSVLSRMRPSLDKWYRVEELYLYNVITAISRNAELVYPIKIYSTYAWSTRISQI